MSPVAVHHAALLSCLRLIQAVDKPRRAQHHAAIHVDTEPIGIDVRLPDAFRCTTKEEGDGRMPMDDPRAAELAQERAGASSPARGVAS